MPSRHAPRFFLAPRPVLLGILALLAAGSAHATGSVVISQVYGGGGNGGSTWTNDFIELYNRSGAPVNLAGWSVQYASSAGTSWAKTDLSAVTLAPGQYYLVQEAQGAGGTTPLPAPDAVGTISMSSSAGKVVLLNTGTIITAGTSCPTGATVVDLVGYGGANCSETAPTAALGNSSAAVRLANGQTDTDNNSADFTIATANNFTPRNTSVSASTVVSVTATDAAAAELGQDPGTFTLTRSGGDTTQSLNVSYSIGGTAANGVDYTPALSGTVSFVANQLTATITLTPVDDALQEGTETATLTVLAGSGYSVGGAPASVSISDDDTPDTAPSVASVSPVAGATNVPTASAVIVSFSEAVNVAAGAVTLSCPGGTVVASNALASNVTSITLTPAVSLPSSTLCTVAVTASGVADVDNNDPPDVMTAAFSSTFTTGTTTACSATDTPIGQIQGTGLTAALTGTRTVQGVVVADYEGADPELRGFYLQNTPATSDGNPATSDGLFIFNSNANSVSTGQVVQVTGPVSEFGFSSAGGTQTQITASTIETCGTGTVDPVDVTLPGATATDLERYEGMLVRFPQVLTVTEHFQLGRFGQVSLSGNGRLKQPTNVLAPGAPALALQAQNDANLVVLDDGQQVQNPDPIVYGRGGLPLSASNTLRGGDTVTALRGVITETDATTASFVPATSDPVRYRIRPYNTLGAVLPNFTPVNLRTAAPSGTAGTVRVTSFNVLNYFNTFGNGACTFGLGGAAADCRGATNATEFTRQTAKTVNAILGTGADVVAINEMENDGYGASSAIQDLVTRLNAISGAGVWTFINADLATGQVNTLGTDAIKVGILYKPSKVTPVGVTAVANTGAFGLFQTGSGVIGRSRPALAQAFRENGTTSAQFIVVANHLKSKGSECTDNISPVGPDPDAGDGQGNCNLTRTAAAQQLVTWLASNPTTTGSNNVLIMGDLNAYAKEDPITTLTNAGYVNLLFDRIGVDAYSYVFDGQWGYLDHALASPQMAPQVASVGHWHINADEPVALDYNTDFQSVGQITSLYSTQPYRSSDHDPVVLGLAIDSDSDGVPDTVEIALGSNPSDLDSDDDGLADGAEDANHNGVVDPGETDPRNADTDGDGIQDGTERGVIAGVADPDGAGPLLGTNPAVFVADADPTTTTSATTVDTDGDGFSDGVEDLNHNGRVDAGESNPGLAGSFPGSTTRKVPAVGPVLAGFMALGLWGVARRRSGVAVRRR